MRSRLRRVLAACACVSVIAGSLGACSTTPASQLREGDCCRRSGEKAEGDAVKRVETVDCSEEHDAEVVGVEKLPAGDFPGQEQLVEIASDVCPPLFEEYTGRAYDEATPEELRPLLPDEDGWNAGDRTIICLAKLPERAEGSIADQQGQ